MTSTYDREKIEAIDTLKQIVKPGDTVYTILRYVSPSAPVRHIGLIVFSDGVPCTLDYHASKALGYRVNKGKNAVVVRGEGMDMGFSVVYNLSQVIFHDGYALKQHWL